MVSVLFSVAHVVFWLSCTLIAINAALILRFGRWSSDGRKLRRGRDVYVVAGIGWLLFSQGFYWNSEGLIWVTIFAFVGAVCCIPSLLELHERSLKWEGYD